MQIYNLKFMRDFISNFFIQEKKLKETNMKSTEKSKGKV
jgi:hypothetical protein